MAGALDVAVESHSATAVKIESIDVAYNGRQIGFKLPRELLRSDGQQTASISGDYAHPSSSKSSGIGAAIAGGSGKPTPLKVFLRFSQSRMVSSVACEIGFRCETADGSDIIWTRRHEISDRPAYFAAHGEYEFGGRGNEIVVDDPQLLARCVTLSGAATHSLTTFILRSCCRAVHPWTFIRRRCVLRASDDPSAAY